MKKNTCPQSALVASFFDVSTRTVNRWKEAGADLTDAGTLLRFLCALSRPIERVEKALLNPDTPAALASLLGCACPPPIDPKTTFAALRLRKMQRQVDLLDLHLRREKGELIPSEGVESDTQAWMMTNCLQLDSFCYELPGVLAGLPANAIKKALLARVEGLKADAKRRIPRFA
jgi:hypothetical protein